MNKRPGHVKVTTEVGFCGFCGRPRNLRREEHQLGTLVRTIITCETCHRTLSSEIGVAQPEPVEAAAPVEAEKAEATPQAEPPAKGKPTAAKRTAKAPARRAGKPASTATRKTTRTK